MDELNKTVSKISTEWRSLHLCPSFTWGRQFRDMSKIGHFNPENDMKNIPSDETGRLFTHCDSNLFVEKGFWLGGPIAVLLNRTYCQSYLQDFIQKYNEIHRPNDVVLTHILSDLDYVCKEPQLGYENEEGGTMYKWNPSPPPPRPPVKIVKRVVYVKQRPGMKMFHSML